jgi:hypothetical protein
MHPDYTFLSTVIERARYLAEDPTADTQYSDAFLARQVIPAEYATVMNTVQLGMENPIVMRYSVDLADGTEYYTLPPSIRQIWRVGKIDDNGAVTHDWYPRGEQSPMGKGWAIEGNMLTFNPIPSSAETWTIWAVPSADFMCHKGSGTLTNISTTTSELGHTVALASAPTLGLLDRRPNAYAGAVLRLVDDNMPIQERVIQSYNVSTRVATVRTPFESTGVVALGTATVKYEVAPYYWQGLWNAIAIRTAFQIGVARNLSEKKMGMLDGLYRHAIKTTRDQLGNMMGRRTKGFNMMTLDNVDFVQPSSW